MYKILIATAGLLVAMSCPSSAQSVKPGASLDELRAIVDRHLASPDCPDAGNTSKMTIGNDGSIVFEGTMLNRRTNAMQSFRGTFAIQDTPVISADNPHYVKIFCEAIAPCMSGFKKDGSLSEGTYICTSGDEKELRDALRALHAGFTP